MLLDALDVGEFRVHAAAGMCRRTRASQRVLTPPRDTQVADPENRATIPARILIASSIVVLAASLVGCASGPARSIDQVVRVETPGCTVAACTLRSDVGEWRIDPTPGEVRVKTSSRPLEVSCVGPGQQTAVAAPTQPLPATSEKSKAVGAGVGGGLTAAVMAPALVTPFAPVAVMVILAGTAAGAGVGTAVDVNQRGWTYPSSVTVPMDCEPATLDRSTWGMAVVGLPDSDAVRLTAVAPAGRAAAAGLQLGDVIVAVDDQPVGGAPGLEAHLRASDRPARLRVLRDSHERIVVLGAATIQ